MSKKSEEMYFPQNVELFLLRQPREARLYVYSSTPILVDLLKLMQGLCFPGADCVCRGFRDQSGQAWAALEVSRCLSAEHAIVLHLHGYTTTGLFRVYSAAPAKCNGRPWPIV